jgi:glutamyl-tRNA(Gln) amidotransferase subunit D
LSGGRVVEESLFGYRGQLKERLSSLNLKVGDIVRIRKGGLTLSGALMPRSQYEDDRHIVLKLDNGYNVGVEVTPVTNIEKVGEGRAPIFTPPPPPPSNPNLPKISIVSTGGTIASRVDYRTGAVFPALSAYDLYTAVPELADLANVETEILFSVFSENLTPRHWSELSKVVYERCRRGDLRGVVVAHGTDTMAYTASALSFALQDLPIPVILVGSQRSSDRPSSDAASNLVGATIAAISAPFAEVGIAMHENVSDESIAIHRGVRARKCHTSRRDAFRSIGTTPLARVRSGKIEMLTQRYRPREAGRSPILRDRFEERVALLKFHPGFDAKLIEHLVESGFRGIVLEGTGLGHVSSSLFDPLRRAREKGVLVAMTSQCVWGRVRMTVYETGIDLLSLGVVPLEDMLAETALVKMMWTLGQTEDIVEARKLMVTDIAGEICERSVYEEV